MQCSHVTPGGSLTLIDISVEDDTGTVNDSASGM